MAGLRPPIHAFPAVTRKTWMPAAQTSVRNLRKLDCVPGMTHEKL
jgi:hypothetical protein